MRAERKPYKRAFAAPAEQKRAPEVVNEKRVYDIKLDFEAKTVSFIAKTLKYLKKMEYYRAVRLGHVARLFAALERGETFPTPIIVNVKKIGVDTKWVIIDGNHRHAAMMRFFRDHPDAKLEILLTQYRDLDTEQEETIFKTANGGIKMNLTDWLSKNQNRLKILRLMRGNFPFPMHVYPLRKKQAGFYVMGLLKPYLSVDTSVNMIFHQEEAMKRIEELDKEDYEALCEFAEDYVASFGQPVKGGVWSRTLSLSALVKVYFWNRERFARNEIIQAWKEKAAGDGGCLDVVRSGGLGDLHQATEKIVEAMNRHITSRRRFMNSATYKKWKEEKGAEQEEQVS